MVFHVRLAALGSQIIVVKCTAAIKKTIESTKNEPDLESYVAVLKILLLLLAQFHPVQHQQKKKSVDKLYRIRPISRYL